MPRLEESAARMRQHCVVLGPAGQFGHQRHVDHMVAGRHPGPSIECRGADDIQVLEAACLLRRSALVRDPGAAGDGNRSVATEYRHRRWRVGTKGLPGRPGANGCAERRGDGRWRHANDREEWRWASSRDAAGRTASSGGRGAVFADCATRLPRNLPKKSVQRTTLSQALAATRSSCA